MEGGQAAHSLLVPGEDTGETVLWAQQSVLSSVTEDGNVGVVRIVGVWIGDLRTNRGGRDVQNRGLPCSRRDPFDSVSRGDLAGSQHTVWSSKNSKSTG